MKRDLTLIAVASLFAASHAWGQECSVSIEANDQIQYTKSELRVSSSCKQVTLTLKHIGELAANVMGHNWVLASAADWQALAQAGQGAGPPNYVPASDDRVLAATKIIGGGEQTSITFDISGLEPGGDYRYFCSFPGHYVLMNGKFIIE